MRSLPISVNADVIRADMAAAERELERVDQIGDAAAVARVRLQKGSLLRTLRAELARAEFLASNGSHE